MEAGANDSGANVIDENETHNSTVDGGHLADTSHDGPAEHTPTPLAVALHNEAPTEPEKKVNWRNRGFIIGGAAVALVGAGAGLFVLGVNSGRSNQANNVTDPGNRDRETSVATTSQAATPETTPSPAETSGETNFTVPEISSSLSAEEMGLAVVQKALVDWRNAGVTETLVADQQASGLGISDYAAATAAKWAPIYENALFIKEWQGYPDLKQYAEQLQTANVQNITLALETAQEQNHFLWVTDSQEVTVTTDSANQRNITVRFRDDNNATQSDAMELDPSAIISNAGLERMDMKLLQYGDAMKISALVKFNIG